jgi:hypothetical protein
MTTILYAQDELTHSQLTKTLRRLRRHTKLGFYIHAEEKPNGMYLAMLLGPKIFWKRKIKVVWEIVDANKTGVSN